MLFFEEGVQWGQNASISYEGSQRQVSLTNKLNTSSYHWFLLCMGIRSALQLLCVWPFQVMLQLKKKWRWCSWYYSDRGRSFSWWNWCFDSVAALGEKSIDHIHVLMIVAILCGKMVKENNYKVSVDMRWQRKYLQWGGQIDQSWR